MTRNIKFLNILIILPFVLNFFFNSTELNHLNFRSLLLGSLCFIGFYYIGKELDKAFNLNSISLAITFYLMGGYLFNYFLLPLDKYFFSFKEVILVYNLLVFIGVIYRTKKIFPGLLLILLVFSIRFVIEFLEVGDNEHVLLNTDVSEFWYPMTLKIYNHDLFFSLKNNIIPGYSLLINYVYAEIYFIFLRNTTYTQLVPNIFLFLNLLIFSELKISIFSKLNFTILYIVALINSDWLSFLFFNSLMGEVIVNYFFSVFLVNAYFNERVKNSKVFYLFLGFSYFLKPFASILFLIIPIYFLLKHRSYIYLFISSFGIILSNFFNQLIFDTDESGVPLQGENNYLNIVIENMDKLTEFKLNNILLILSQEILIDKVLTLFLMLYFFSILLFRRGLKSINLMNFTMLTNTFLVFSLYATIWQNIELGSAYRYIFSFINILFIDFAIKMDTKINFFQKIGPSNRDQ